MQQDNIVNNIYSISFPPYIEWENSCMAIKSKIHENVNVNFHLNSEGEPVAVEPVVVELEVPKALILYQTAILLN